MEWSKPAHLFDYGRMSLYALNGHIRTKFNNMICPWLLILGLETVFTKEKVGQFTAQMQQNTELTIFIRHIYQIMNNKGHLILTQKGTNKFKIAICYHILLSSLITVKFESQIVTFKYVICFTFGADFVTFNTAEASATGVSGS